MRSWLGLWHLAALGALVGMAGASPSCTLTTATTPPLTSLTVSCVDGSRTLQAAINSTRDPCGHCASGTFTASPFLGGSWAWVCGGRSEVNLTSLDTHEGTRLLIDPSEMVIWLRSGEVVLSVRGELRHQLEVHLDACLTRPPVCASPAFATTHTEAAEWTCLERVGVVARVSGGGVMIEDTRAPHQPPLLALTSSHALHPHRNITNWTGQIPSKNLVVNVTQSTASNTQQHQTNLTANMTNTRTNTFFTFTSHTLKLNEEGDIGPSQRRRVEEVKQRIDSEVFTLSSNMTTDVTARGEHIIAITQESVIPFCPALNWSLRQIFNFSSGYSGWEYVVSQWAWGSMVVESHWGHSYLHLYKKSWAFDTDRGSPVPSTHILLDFQDYKHFHVKLKFPTLGEALLFSLEVGQDYQLTVRTVDEYDPGNTSALVEARAEARGGDYRVSWSVRDAETLPVLRIIKQSLDDGSLCGPRADKKILYKFWSDMFEGGQFDLLSELLSAFGYLHHIKEVQVIKHILQQYSGKDASWVQLAMVAGERLGVLQLDPGWTNGFVVKAGHLNQVVQTLMRAVEWVRACGARCDPHQEPPLVHLLTALTALMP